MSKNKYSQSPIIVVGRPRSGSTIFTRLLNESPDLSIVNDFYYLQYVDSLGGFSRQDASLMKKLSRQILSTIRDRHIRNHQGIQGIECAQIIDSEKLEKLETFVEHCNSQPGHDWASLFGSIMQYHAILFDKKNWGYNTPQDFLHLPRLQQAFPNAKFIFVMRDPREVLRSYKYMEYREGFHDPACYHPILQAIAWKSAMASFLENQDKDNFLLIKYEDIVKDVNQVFANVGDFINTKFTPINLKDFDNNSTFKNKKKNKLKLNDTETWLCEHIAKEEMQEAGYSLQNCQPSINDLGNILYVTQRSLVFYLKKILASSDIRKRVFSLIESQ